MKMIGGAFMTMAPWNCDGVMKLVGAFSLDFEPGIWNQILGMNGNSETYYSKQKKEAGLSKISQKGFI